jgi:hypothetical protein
MQKKKVGFFLLIMVASFRSFRRIMEMAIQISMDMTF